MTEVTETNNEDKIAEARRIVAEEDKRLNTEASTRRTAYREPVKELTSSPEWKFVMESVSKIRENHEDDDILAIHVNALGDNMGRFDHALGFSETLAPSETIDPPAEEAE